MRRRSGLAVGVLVCIAAYLARYPILSELGRRLIVEDNAGQSEIALVLAGDSIAGDRMLAGAAFGRDGHARKVYVSGPRGMYGINEADAAIEFAVKAGYPASLFIAARNTSQSTAEEADQILAVLRAQPERRLAVITSNFHTRRAARVWRAKAPDFEIRIIAVPCAVFKPDAWWTEREGQKIFLIEWEKTIAAWLGL